MKIKELLLKLNEANTESEVYFDMNDGCCGDSLSLEAYDVETISLSDGNSHVRVYFKSLPGYRSCIQSGDTKRKDEEYWKNKKGNNHE